MRTEFRLDGSDVSVAADCGIAMSFLAALDWHHGAQRTLFNGRLYPPGMARCRGLMAYIYNDTYTLLNACKWVASQLPLEQTPFFASQPSAVDAVVAVQAFIEHMDRLVSAAMKSNSEIIWRTLEPA